jgi:predicted amidohydrolase YtcJ
MMDFRIDPERRLIEIRLAGLLKLDQTLKSLTALRTDPLYDPGYSQLVDCREAEFSEITPDALRALADRNRKASDRVVAFVCHDDAVDKILRLYTAYLGLEGGKRHVSIFRDPAKALAWIEEVRGVSR